MIFKKWKAFLEPNIILMPLELAGRGARMQDPTYHSVVQAVDDIWDMMKDQIQDEPYALFGHSMGAMLAYELVLKIRKMKGPMPVHVFFSGRSAPHWPVGSEKKYHLLNGKAFEDKVLELGGTPPEFFEHNELREIYLPILRSDFALAATDFSEREIQPFEFSMSVFVGKEEDLSPAQVVGWKEHTYAMCIIYYFNGDHFFINEQLGNISRIINQAIGLETQAIV